MKTQKLTPAMAELELVLLTAEAESFSDTDFYAWLRESGLPSEAAIRLKALVDATLEIGGRIVNIGRLLIVKILDFANAHPNLAIGVAIGAAIAALVGMVPFLGTYLGPIAAVVGISLGAIAGHRKDMADCGRDTDLGSGPLAIGADVIDIAKAFFKLLIELFQVILNGSLPRKV